MRRLLIHIAEPLTRLDAEYVTYVLVTHKPFALTSDDRVYGRSVTVLKSPGALSFKDVPMCDLQALLIAPATLSFDVADLVFAIKESSTWIKLTTVKRHRKASLHSACLQSHQQFHLDSQRVVPSLARFRTFYARMILLNALFTSHIPASSIVPEVHQKRSRRSFFNGVDHIRQA
jgi:hypothetical protein